MYFLIQHIAAWNFLLEDLVKIKLKNNTTSQNQECKYLWGKKYTNENLKPNPNQNNETCSYYLWVWSIFSIVLVDASKASSQVNTALRCPILTHWTHGTQLAGPERSLVWPVGQCLPFCLLNKALATQIIPDSNILTGSIQQNKIKFKSPADYYILWNIIKVNTSKSALEKDLVNLGKCFLTTLFFQRAILEMP